MAEYGVTASEIEAQIRASNVELPVGSVQGQHIMLTLLADKPLQTVEHFKNLIIKQSSQIGQITLQDVANVYMGAIERRRFFKGNGMPMVGIGIIKQSNANTLSVAQLARERKTLVNESLPEGLELKDSYDASVFVQEAVNEVYKTLFISLGLVVLVMLVFLKNVRAALVPAVTLPVSLIATFWVLWMLGFSVNLLTLLALVLAIGLVVDDAIVVLENTQRHLDMGYRPIAPLIWERGRSGLRSLPPPSCWWRCFCRLGFRRQYRPALFRVCHYLSGGGAVFQLGGADAVAGAGLQYPQIDQNRKNHQACCSPCPLVESPFFKKFLIKNLRHPIWVWVAFSLCWRP